MRLPPLLLLAALLVPTLLSAQKVSAPLDFPNGPAQWLMTPEEKRAWKGVKSAAQAQELIDLFWVRRDPTPNTFANEFRTEFDQRVAFADRRFQEGRRRGALTERGRVVIVLGFPQELGEEASKTSAQYAGGDGLIAMDPTGGRATAARDVWNYSHAQAIKFGLPKIEVVFIRDGSDGRVRRDTHRNDFISALPVAIRSYIKNADLTAVPEWARHGKQSPVVMVPAAAATTRSVEPPLPDAPPVVAASQDPQAGEAPVAAVRPASVGKLTLVKDAFALQPESGVDPFAGLQSVSEFGRDEELGWVIEYCTGTVTRELSSVEVAMKISGLINDERVNFNAPPEEMVPDKIKASPGCYLVRGAIPVMDMDPGTYTMMLTMGRYNLTKEFRVIGQ